MIALTIIVLALAGFSRALTTSIVTADQHSETTLALEAARQMMETLQAAPFQQVFALYNSNPDDDPGGGPAPGPGFAVQGLQALPGAPGGFVGEILFPTMGTGAALELREDVVDPVLGMPRDLNGDGVIDSEDHSAGYSLLPVLVRVSWRSPSGPARVELKTLLANY